MGLWLEAVCKLLIWRKHEDEAASVWPSTGQVKAAARSSAFSLQASPHGLQCVLRFPRRNWLIAYGSNYMP